MVFRLISKDSEVADTTGILFDIRDALGVVFTNSLLPLSWLSKSLWISSIVLIY